MENIKVKKLTKYSLFILVLLFAVFSCGRKEEEKSKANAETKVNEKSGKKYDRIVVLDPAVGISAWRRRQAGRNCQTGKIKNLA